MANKSEQIKILVSIPDGEVRDSFFSEELRARLERLGCVEWNANAEQYGEKELAEKLKLIAHIGGSVRPMVGDAAFERGIWVCSGNRVFAESVAEGVLAYMLCSLRRIGEYEARMAAGSWSHSVIFLRKNLQRQASRRQQRKKSSEPVISSRSTAV